MPQTTSEMAAILSVILGTEDNPATDKQVLTDQDCEQMLSDAFATRSYQSTQCFVCSRIYFDQTLQKCPHCKSESLHHYTTAVSFILSVIQHGSRSERVRFVREQLYVEAYGVVLDKMDKQVAYTRASFPGAA